MDYELKQKQLIDKGLKKYEHVKPLSKEGFERQISINKNTEKLQKQTREAYYSKMSTLSLGKWFREQDHKDLEKTEKMAKQWNTYQATIYNQ